MGSPFQQLCETCQSREMDSQKKELLCVLISKEVESVYFPHLEQERELHLHFLKSSVLLRKRNLQHCPTKHQNRGFQEQKDIPEDITFTLATVTKLYPQTSCSSLINYVNAKKGAKNIT